MPVVLELGPRDIAAGKIGLKQRDTGSKEAIALSDVTSALPAALSQMQVDLLAAATERTKSRTVLANSIEEVESILSEVTAEKGNGRFVMAHLADDPACDERVKAFKASVRSIPLIDEYDGPGKCIVTGNQWIAEL